jgi:hypothetical protein
LLEAENEQTINDIVAKPPIHVEENGDLVVRRYEKGVVAVGAK